jgi:hypothetical protein
MVIMQRIAGYILAGTAVLACPCHLLLLLGLIAPALGGSALGAALTGNLQLVVLGATVYFLLALAGAWWLLSWREAESTAPALARSGTGADGRAPASADACCRLPAPAAQRRPAES